MTQQAPCPFALESSPGQEQTENVWLRLPTFWGSELGEATYRVVHVMYVPALEQAAPLVCMCAKTPTWGLRGNEKNTPTRLTDPTINKSRPTGGTAHFHGSNLFTLRSENRAPRPAWTSFMRWGFLGKGLAGEPASELKFAPALVRTESWGHT